MAVFVNAEHITEYIKEIRSNKKINISPETDVVFLSLQELLQFPLNPLLFDGFIAGECNDCAYKERHQKCSCCRRNRSLKDCYKKKE